MSSLKTTRRGFVAAGAASTLALATGSTGTTARAATNDPNLVSGVVKGVESARVAEVELHEGGTVHVVVAPTAFVQHGVDGVVKDLTPFEVGETVVIRGERSGSTITSTEFQSLYREVSGQVLGIATNGDIRSSAGVLRVTERVRQNFQLGALRPGDRFAATVWTDASTGEVYAFVLRREV